MSSVINLSIKHGRDLADARERLAQAVQQVQTKFGMFIQRTEWNPTHDAVTIAGTGFKIDMRVDAEHVFVEGDIPIVGKLLGSPIVAGIKGALQNTFQKKLT